MKHLLGGQIGLEDFIFAHRKGNNFCDIIDCKQLTLNYFVKIASAATHKLVESQIDEKEFLFSAFMIVF